MLVLQQQAQERENRGSVKHPADGTRSVANSASIFLPQIDLIREGIRRCQDVIEYYNFQKVKVLISEIFFKNATKLLINRLDLSKPEN